MEYRFDFKVGDECHHLTGEYDPDKDIKRYTQFHIIQSKKTLFMTGTNKTIVNMTTDKQISSMDNEELFGKVIFYIIIYLYVCIVLKLLYIKK